MIVFTVSMGSSEVVQLRHLLYSDIDIEANDFCGLAQESCHLLGLLAPDDSKIVAATRIKVLSSYPRRTADQSSG